MYLYEEDLSGVDGYIQGCQGVAGETIGAFGKGPPTAGQVARKPSQADAFREAKAKLAAAARVRTPPGRTVSAAAKVAPAIARAANPEAAKRLMFLQRALELRDRAKTVKRSTKMYAKMISKKAKLAKKGDKKAEAELQGLWSSFKEAVTSPIKTLVTPLTDYTGITGPSAQEVEDARKDAERVAAYVAEQKAAGKQVTASVKLAATTTQTAAKDLKTARENILKLPSAQGWLDEVGSLISKLKWAAIIGGVGLTAFIAWPYVKALRAPGKGLAGAGEAIGTRIKKALGGGA